VRVGRNGVGVGDGWQVAVGTGRAMWRFEYRAIAHRRADRLGPPMPPLFAKCKPQSLNHAASRLVKPPTPTHNPQPQPQPPPSTYPVEILYTKAPETDYLDAALITVMQVGGGLGWGWGWGEGARNEIWGAEILQGCRVRDLGFFCLEGSSGVSSLMP